MPGQLMPKPERSVSPVGFRGPNASVYAAAGSKLGQAGAQLGLTIAEIGKRKQEEYDTATAEDAFNTFRDMARESYFGHLGRKGAEANGVMKDYEVWYAKEGGDIMAKLENDRQQQLFDILARRRLNSDLDSLAKHEANEHWARLKASTTATKVGVIKEASMNLDADVGGMLEEGFASIDRSNPGKDNSLEKTQFEIDVRKARINEVLRVDALKARDLLKQKEWKDGLGPAYTDVREAVESEALFVEATQKHPDDFDKQEDFVKKRKGVTEATKKTIIGRIRSYEAEDESREAEAKTARRTSASNNYWEALGRGDRVEAVKIAQALDVEGGDFTEQERQAMISRAQDVVQKTDDYKMRQMRWDILMGKFTDPAQLYLDERSLSIDNEDMRVLESQLAKELQDPSEYTDALNDVEWAFRNMHKEDPDQGLKFLIFQREFLKVMDTFKADKKRNPTPDEVRALALDGLEKRVKDGWFGWDIEAPSKFEESAKARKPGRADKEKKVKVKTTAKAEGDEYEDADDPLGIR